MRIYKLELFKKYLFFVDGKELKVLSLCRKKFLKKYYSTLKKKWRYKLVTKFGHSLQFSEKKLLHWVLNKGLEI